ncbi:ATP phosphoribosyltransferase [Marilutibacter chinensis]|uniref:ATP phosphoribosyltransferase n=1 Tax=Marilutibacter chinensis TaxID=2912247 RepID=A0ABS9HRM3_9GAMM|nr:ATP phosphoribosyltransferase [Lysobacter chinensis]MCF7220805.1 ATP phosphoribosyltransferase [Lysobacter chinensis]
MNPKTGNGARDRLRIAIQKSGRLAEPARALLTACGLSWRESRDRLFCYGESLPVDLLLVRDDDIPGLIRDGVCDLGVVGRNVLLEQDIALKAGGGSEAFREWRPLGFGGCRLAIAVPETWAWQSQAQLAGTRLATSYPAILRQWLDGQGIAAEVVELSGSVEIAPRLGQADAICDLVSSGATLAANQLKPVMTLLESEAVLAGPSSATSGASGLDQATPRQPAFDGIWDDARAGLAELLLRRLDGVLRMRHSKLLMFQASREAIPSLLPLLPDAEAPTVMQIDGGDGLALQALCHGAVTWQRLEELKRAGARGLLVLPVEGMLA